MVSRTPTLTRKDVARRAAAIRDAPLYQAEPWVAAVLEAMADLLAAADPEVRIELRDFGVLEVKRTRARPAARNPRTNQVFYVPSRRKTHFRPGKRLRDALDTPLSELGYVDPPGSAEPPRTGGRR